jgi:hypothetical protein
MPVANSTATNAGQIELALEGVRCGNLFSVEGGEISAEVVSILAAGHPFPKKHLGVTHYADFVVRFGFGLDDRLYHWVTRTLAGKLAPQDGVITVRTAQAILDQRRFQRGTLTEFTVPDLDALSKEPAFFTARIRPESIGRESSVTKPELPLGRPADHRWLSSGFRLSIDGLDCKRVRRIESFTVRQRSLTDSVGDQRIPAAQRSGLEFPHLRVFLGEAGASTWFDWHEDFVVKGHCEEAQERKGVLAFFSPEGKELAQLRCSNLGIFRLSWRTGVAGAEQLPLLVADLYCEQMEFSLGKSQPLRVTVPRRTA